MTGWVKLHRELLEKAIWKCSNDAQRVVLITCLLKANHKENEWIWCGKKFTCKPGQFVTSLSNLAKEAGVSVQSVRSALKKFQELGFLQHEVNKQANKQSSLITICNYKVYQGSDFVANTPDNTQPTHSQHTANTQPTTNKNDNNYKNKTFDDFWSAYPRKENKTKALWVWQSKVHSDDLASQIIEHVQNRVGNDSRWIEPEYIPLPDTFLRDERWTDQYVVAKQFKTELNPYFLKVNRERAKESGAAVMAETKDGTAVWIFPNGNVEDFDGRRLA